MFLPRFCCSMSNEMFTFLLQSPSAKDPRELFHQKLNYHGVIRAICEICGLNLLLSPLPSGIFGLILLPPCWALGNAPNNPWFPSLRVKMLTSCLRLDRRVLCSNKTRSALPITFEIETSATKSVFISRSNYL
jgi:hypothetical protein